MTEIIEERGQKLWPSDVPLGNVEIIPGRIGATPGLEVSHVPDAAQLSYCRAKSGECRARRVGDTDYCIGHLRKIRAEETARALAAGGDPF
jgi:hypothetical protein